MNFQPEPKKREGNPVTLVWLITLLSFSVGVFMVYLVWSMFTDIRTERENLFELKENFTSIQAKLESGLAKQKSEVSVLLEAATGDSTTEKDPSLPDLIRDYHRAVSSPELMPAFEQLEKNITSLLIVKDKLTWWAGAYNRTVAKIPQTRTEVKSILERIFETVDKAEGQQRLERAAKNQADKTGYS